MINVSTCGDGGALGGTRTPNLLIRSQMLYPLSYERTGAPLVYATRTPLVPARRSERPGCRARSIRGPDHAQADPGRGDADRHANERVKEPQDGLLPPVARAEVRDDHDHGRGGLAYSGTGMFRRAERGDRASTGR